MATTTPPAFDPPVGTSDPAKSNITVTYVVMFDSYDMAMNTPYREGVTLIGDDTNVSGDGAGGVDDQILNSWNVGTVFPSDGNPQIRTKTFPIDTAKLNEDSAAEPENKNPDEIRARIILTPRVAEEFKSAESNLRTLNLP